MYSFQEILGEYDRCEFTHRITMWEILLIDFSLDNLITNAIKFTTQGFVKLSATCQLSGSTALLEVMIEDSGIGIDQQDLGKLFHPFVQADQSTTRIYGGSGLGLSIAKKVRSALNHIFTVIHSLFMFLIIDIASRNDGWVDYTRITQRIRHQS